MKTFYSAADIEALASQGVRELIVDDDTVLTSVAQEAAAQFGLKLVSPRAAALAAAAAAAAAQGAAPGANPGKPRGCQHGPLAGGQAPAASANRGTSGSQSPVVDELIGAVKQLAKRG